jgi:hypothetical protein
MMLRNIFAVAVVGIIGVGGGQAWAVNLLTNGSFEAGTYTLNPDGAVDVPPGGTSITGWTVVTNNVSPVSNVNSFGLSAQDGVFSLDLQGYADGFPYGGVTQNLATIIGAEYELRFWIGVHNSIPVGVGPASVLAAAGGTSQTFTTSLSAAGQQWQEFTLPFTATGAVTPITLSGILTTGGAYIGLDNVSVELVALPVPEPAGLGLLGLGVMGTLLRRRVTGR